MHMDKETIKKLYLAKAQLKHMNFIDPMRPMAEQTVGALEEEYAEHLNAVNSREKTSAKEDDVPWQACLQYVGGLFAAMDDNEKEEEHDEQMKFRQMVWTILSNAVSNYYCQKKPED